MILIVNGRRLQTDDCQIMKLVRNVDGHGGTAVIIHAEMLPDWVKDLEFGSYAVVMQDDVLGIGGTLTKAEYDWTPEMVGRTAGLLPVFKEAPLRITLTMERVPAP